MLEIMIRALKSSLRPKARTMLTLMGIAVGIASVILTLGLGQSGSDAITKEIDLLGMGGLSVTQGNDNAPLTEKELHEIELMKNVTCAMPIIFDSGNAYLDNEARSVYLWGIDNNADSTISLSLKDGRFFNAGDMAGAGNVCMIDEKLASEHFGRSDPIGKTLTISSGNNTANYTVTGIIKTGSGLLENVMGSVIPEFIYIPLTTMQNNIASRNFTQIIIKTNDSTDIETARNDILKAMERKTGIKNGYVVTNLAKQKENLNNIIGIFTLVITAIGAISLLVAGMNIMNVMLTSVSERTREIGIKKAIGASGADIAAEFLAESSSISLVGCLAGMAGAVVILLLISLVLGLTIQLSIGIMILLPLFSVITGSAFGLYPAIKAASLKPVDALRHY